jgi:hypothetical protein
MPDVDRFGRALRGKYWRSAYRLSFSDANGITLRDTISKACAAHLRKAFPADCVRRCPQLIFKSLAAKKRELLTEESAVFLEFTKELEQFDSEKHDFAAVQIIKKVAQSVFANLEARSAAITSSEVENCFSKELIERLIRHFFLAPVRDRIASKRNQSSEQQMDWENKLIADVSARWEGSLQSFFRKRDSAIRAPKRLTRQRRMTMDELNKGLTVMES